MAEPPEAARVTAELGVDPVVVDDWGTRPVARPHITTDPGTATGTATGSAGAAGPARSDVFAMELTIAPPGQPPYLIRIERGRRVLLGRDPAFSDHAGYLGQFELLSRRHVSVGVDDAGAAWLRDEYAMNRARVDLANISAGEQVPLTDGADVQVCPGLGATVRLITEARR
jgi:hypothetical protein